MKAMRLEDMSPRLRRLAEAALGSGVAPRVGVAGSEGRAGNVKRFARRRGPNKTEARYARDMLTGKDARFEAVAFYFDNGHRYRPDFVVFENGRPTECHEVKGGYALHSQQRARLAWDQARVEFPGLKWVWAVWDGSAWIVDRREPKTLNNH